MIWFLSIAFDGEKFRLLFDVLVFRSSCLVAEIHILGNQIQTTALYHPMGLFKKALFSLISFMYVNINPSNSLQVRPFLYVIIKPFVSYQVGQILVCNY